MADIVQLSPEIFIMTPLGEMSVFALIDYGLHLNPMLMGSLCACGSIVCVSSEECKRMGNATLDISDPKPFTDRRIK